MYKILFAACLFMAAACSKPGKPDNNHEQPEGAPLTMRRGNPIAALATATIGPQGGQLASVDGILKMIVPAGAVTSSQTFSIQEVENILQPGKPRAFRLLPENSRFGKPVTIVMQYDPNDLTIGTEDVLRMAYQNNAGAWKSVKASLNKNAHTLSAEVDHFCDFTFYEQFELLSGKDILMPGEKTTFKVGVVKVAGEENDDDLLAPLVAYVADSFYRNSDFIYEQLSNYYAAKINGWKVADGPGTITPQKNAYNVLGDAEYTAPTQSTGFQEAIVEVNLEGTKPIPDPAAPGGKRVLGQLILRKKVMIAPDYYAVATFNGQEYHLAGDHNASAQNGLMAIAAVDNTGSPGFTISIGAMAAGSYACGITNPGGGKAAVYFNYKLPNGNPVSASTVYCESINNQTVTKYSGGQVTITKFGAPGEVIEGEWSGDIYQEKPNTSGCQYETKPLTIRFRLRRVA